MGTERRIFEHPLPTNPAFRLGVNKYHDEWLNKGAKFCPSCGEKLYGGVRL